MKIFREHVIVKVPSIFIDETKYKGIDGKTLITNVLFNPERHVRCFGIVASVPDELFLYPISQKHIGAPAYNDYPPFEWKTNQDIQLEIQVGDKIYFHYNSLLPDQSGGNMWNKMFLFTLKEQENGKEVKYHYFRVKYDLVYAAVRYEKTCATMTDFAWWMEPELKETKITRLSGEDGEHTEEGTFYIYNENTYRKKVVMIGGYVFIEPDMESWDDISIPVAETINGVQILNPDGSVKMKPKEQWLVMKTMPGEKYLRGWVRHCGSPLKGDKEFLRPGMYVYFQRFADTHINFEGFDYFRLRQHYIFCIDHEKSQQHATV